MTKAVEFYFDVGSPASYLAATRLPKLCADAGAALVYKPMLLGGVFQATGNQSPMMVAPKGRYVFDDLSRHAQRHGIALKHNPHFPIHTLSLMRGATAMQLRHPDRFLAYLDVMWRAIWVDGRDLNDGSVVAAVLQRNGFDPAAVMAEATDPEVKATLKSTTEEAVARGVFGAPTMFVGSSMYFGQDRLEFVREALAAS